MKRSIAKILIQYFYDSSSTYAKKVDPLPRWLRNWTDRDELLAQFEGDLLRLQNQLVSQAESHLATFRQSIDSVEFAVRSLPPRFNSTRRNPIYLAALATGLCCVLLGAGWFVWQLRPGSQSQRDIATNEFKTNADKTKESQMGLASIPSDQLVLSTWEATKRIASDFKQKSGHANHRLALVSQNELKKQLREVSNEGLRFVAQKLPQATVRMLGMQVNSNKGY